MFKQLLFAAAFAVTAYAERQVDEQMWVWDSHAYRSMGERSLNGYLHRLWRTRGGESLATKWLVRGRGNTFTTAAGFVYFIGCDGQGKYCNNPNCPEAFHNPWDYQAQVQCEANDITARITLDLRNAQMAQQTFIQGRSRKLALEVKLLE
ncbi:hypothetical protein IW262DRAFT_1535593 [Armillaria fumosa]|nr:hypothetical protein IW262DRAFT_1535593 [Armillaria fumosa]